MFGRLNIIEGSEFKSGKLLRPKILCVCVCGKICEAWVSDLRTGKKKSCGCLRRETSRNTGNLNKKHGMTFTPTYRTWYSMKKRCGSDGLYKNINYTPEWEYFENFLRDMGERPPGKTLDRIDGLGNYNKENCRWATPKEQTLNRKTTRWFTYRDKTLCLKDWSVVLKVSVPYLEKRLLSDRLQIKDIISETGNSLTDLTIF